MCVCVDVRVKHTISQVVAGAADAPPTTVAAAAAVMVITLKADANVDMTRRQKGKK